MPPSSASFVGRSGCVLVISYYFYMLTLVCDTIFNLKSNLCPSIFFLYPGNVRGSHVLVLLVGGGAGHPLFAEYI